MRPTLARYEVRDNRFPGNYHSDNPPPKSVFPELGARAGQLFRDATREIRWALASVAIVACGVAMVLAFHGAETGGEIALAWLGWCVVAIGAIVGGCGLK